MVVFLTRESAALVQAQGPSLFIIKSCDSLLVTFWRKIITATRCFSREYKTHAPRITPRTTINSLSLGSSPRRIYKAPDEEIHAHANRPVKDSLPAGVVRVRLFG